MLSIFREKSSVSVFWLVALSIVIHSHFIVAPPQVVINNQNVWLQSLLSPFVGLPSVVLILLYHAIVIVQALRLSAVLNNLRMFPKQYFIPALCYLLLTALYPLWNNITPSLLINFFVIWLFTLTAKLYSSPRAKPLIFNIGLLVGFISLLYPTALFFIATSFFALLLLRAFRLNEWMILLLGIATPAYLFAAVLFLNDNLKGFLAFLPHFHWHLLSIQNHTPLVIALLAGALLIVSGIFAWQANVGKMVIQTRRCWSVLFFMFLFSVPLLFGISGEDMPALLLGMVPAAALASNTFVYAKNNVLQVILFWLVVVAVIFNNWYWLKT